MAPCRSRVGMKELFSTGSGILGRSFDIGDFPPRLRLREFLASAFPVTKRQGWRSYALLAKEYLPQDAEFVEGLTMIISFTFALGHLLRIGLFALPLFNF